MSEPSESELCEWAAGFVEPKPTETPKHPYKDGPSSGVTEQWVYAWRDETAKWAWESRHNFATSLNAVALVERKIAEMGCEAKARYVDELLSLAVVDRRILYRPAAGGVSRLQRKRGEEVSDRKSALSQTQANLARQGSILVSAVNRLLTQSERNAKQLKYYYANRERILKKAAERYERDKLPLFSKNNASPGQ